MSLFAVSFTHISSVKPHSNADRLDIATVEGSSYQFVTGRNQFKTGAEVLYFPIDAIIPEAILQKIGLVGKLAGKNKDRVKTICLRGEISQGIVAPPSEVLPDHSSSDISLLTPESLTELLGVVKYIPPEKPCLSGRLLPLPDGQSMYDLENAENYNEVVDSLMDQEVVITEKVEGSNFSVSVSQKGEVSVNQRCNSIHPELDTVGPCNHDFWKVARAQGLIEAAIAIHVNSGGKHVVLYGEYLGPGMMGNIYGFPKNKILCFDLKIDYRFVGWKRTCEAIDGLPGVEWVPIVYLGKLRDFLNGKPFPEVSNGKSALADTLREGLVIKPLDENIIAGFGRAIIKQRSPKYLAAE